MKVEKRINEIVNRLNKTKTERFPDLRVEREQRDQEEREDKRKEMQEKVFSEEYILATLLNVLLVVDTLYCRKREQNSKVRVFVAIPPMLLL